MATRRERVILELETNFPTKAAEAAAAIRLLNEEVNRVGGRGGNSRPLKMVGDDVEQIGNKSQKAGASIDKLSGRVNLLAKAAAVLGPSLVPIGAVGIPAITGLASSLGFAALGAGTAVLAFQGVGDALKAMNKAHLEPTQANLDAARLAMEQISPAAQAFVVQLKNMMPELDRLKEVAATGMFPGLTEGLDDLSAALPAVQRIVSAVAGELGDLGAEAGAALGGPEFAAFFTFLEREAPKAIDDFASGIGHVTHAMAELWMAFGPINSGFSSWLVDSTRALDDWAAGLANTQGFAEFMDYLQTSGPRVAEAMGALANAVLQIVEAAAPLGGPVLAGITAFANAIAAVANSDLGTPIFGALAAFSALNLAMNAATKITTTFTGAQTRIGSSVEAQKGKVSALAAEYRALRTVQNFQHGKVDSFGGPAGLAAANRFKGTLKETAVQAGKTGAAVAGLAVATTGVADKFGATNTATLALMGTMAGPYGAAIGAAIGATIDFAAANDSLHDALIGANAAMKSGDIDALTASYDRLAAASENAYGFDVSKQNVGLKDTINLNPLKALHEIQGVLNRDMQKTRDRMAEVTAAMNGGAATGALKLAGGFFKLGGAFGQTAAESRRAAVALSNNRAAANATAHSFVTLGKNLDNAKVSLNGWIRQLARQADDLRNFANNAQKAADKGLRHGLIKALQEAGPEGARRMRQLSNATESEINKANRAWGKGQKAIRDYTNTVGGVPKTKKTTIETNAEAERRRVQLLQAAINSLHGKTVTNYVNTIRRGGLDSRGPVASGVGFSADGSTVPKTGKPYADRHLYMLADGEEVISNRYGQADRHRDLLKAINANRLANGGTAGIPGLAKGGTARSTRRTHELHELANFRAALVRSTAAIDKEKAARDAIAAKRSELASTVAGQFQHDIFGGSSVWQAGGGAGGAFGVLKGDIAQAKAFQSLLGGLHKRGLNGDALAELAKTGDIGKAQSFASMSTADLRTYESLFNQRAAAANAAGAYAGTAAYGAQQAVANTHLHNLVSHAAAQQRAINALTRELKSHPTRTGHAVGHAINGAAGKSKRSKR